MREADKRMYYIVSPNSFAYNPARINVGSIGYQDTGKSVIVSSLYEVFKTSDDVDDRLLWHWIKSPDFQKLIMQLQEGGVRLYFYYDKLCMGQVPLPSLEEQRKIGKLFDTLDHLITLHQRKYDKLQVLKKAMLEKMFPKNGSSVPEIRFKGFTDAWEQRKVSDLAEKTYGGGTPTTSNEAYWNGDIPWIQSSDVVDGKLLGVEPRKRITQNGLNNSAAQLIPENSIAIITRVGVGKLAFMPYSYATSQDFLSLSKLNAEPLFTVYACYKKLQSELNAVQGTSIKGITKDELLTRSIMVPQYAEQQQIGSFFQQLDHLITLHQRKYDKLQVLKKAMLEKMFPKNGSSVPEIRFKGFTDAWEQRKLGKIVERITRKNENLESTLPLTISAQYGLIDQNEFFDKRIASKDVSGYFLVKNGEFAYNKSTSSDAPWGAIKRLDRYESGVLSTLYIVFKILDERKTSSDYVVTYYNTDLWHKGIQAIAAEGARNHGLLNVAPADFFETNLTMPKDYAEQQQIGSFFQQLDSLITLHQRELEKLQNIKKSMLEKMFV